MEKKYTINKAILVQEKLTGSELCDMYLCSLQKDIDNLSRINNEHLLDHLDGLEIELERLTKMVTKLEEKRC